ncbi:MAG: hypothetical protein V4735_01770 [Pseudomonadota bacterium]
MRDVSSIPHSPSSEPLHQLVLAFGKSMLPWGGSAKSKTPRLQVRAVAMHQRYDLGESLITEQSRVLAIGQFVTSLRMQGLDDEASALLGLLESLVLEGEIAFPDFMGRIQNLFPRALDKVDVSLRMKINALMIGQ